MQKHVNLVDLVKSFPTNIYLQNLASIQKRTSPVKFAHFAEKSGNGSISNLSTKVRSDIALLKSCGNGRRQPTDGHTEVIVLVGCDAGLRADASSEGRSAAGVPQADFAVGGASAGHNIFTIRCTNLIRNCLRIFEKRS